MKLKYYFVRLFKRSLYKEFNHARKDLTKHIIKVIEEQGQEIYGEEVNRIIHHDEI